MGCQFDEPVEGGATSFTVAMPRLTYGRGSLDELGAVATRRGLKRVALFTDPHLVSSSIIERAQKSLHAAGVETALFHDIRIEPCDRTVTDATRFLSDAAVDGMVSVGGGSVMDTAKAALACSRYDTPVLDYFAAPIGAGTRIQGPVLPHIACPTTTGTGSECTSVSVIRINALNTKFVIGSPYLLPDEAIVDPSCFDSLPGQVIASTGFDALCHALECFTAKAYNQQPRVDDVNARQYIQGANPFSEIGAVKALQLVSDNIVRAVADQSDQQARDNLGWAATIAGIAFGNSGTHLPHAMSYGVTHLMNNITTPGYSVDSPFVPHGISVIVSAPAIFRYLSEGDPQRHLQAAQHIGADTNGAGPEDSGEIIANRLIELMQNTHVPNGLSGVGFGADHVNALADSSIRQKRAILNAPRESNLVDLQNIYAAAISYW